MRSRFPSGNAKAIDLQTNHLAPVLVLALDLALVLGPTLGLVRAMKRHIAVAAGHAESREQGQIWTYGGLVRERLGLGDDDMLIVIEPISHLKMMMTKRTMMTRITKRKKTRMRRMTHCICSCCRREESLVPQSTCAIPP